MNIRKNVMIVQQSTPIPRVLTASDIEKSRKKLVNDVLTYYGEDNVFICDSKDVEFAFNQVDVQFDLHEVSQYVHGTELFRLSKLVHYMAKADLVVFDDYYTTIEVYAQSNEMKALHQICNIYGVASITASQLKRAIYDKHMLEHRFNNDGMSGISNGIEYGEVFKYPSIPNISIGGVNYSSSGYSKRDITSPTDKKVKTNKHSKTNKVDDVNNEQNTYETKQRSSCGPGFDPEEFEKIFGSCQDAMNKANAMADQSNTSNENK